MGDGKDRQEVDIGFPLNVGGGWMHVLQIADKKNKKMYVYYNFKKVYEADMFDKFAELDLDTDMDFNVGNDGLGTFSNERYDMQLCMDDFIVFGDALGEDEIANLRKYYGLN